MAFRANDGAEVLGKLGNLQGTELEARLSYPPAELIAGTRLVVDPIAFSVAEVYRCDKSKCMEAVCRHRYALTAVTATSNFS